MSTSEQSQSQKGLLSDGYQPIEGTYDEALTICGDMHEHWSNLLNHLNMLGHDNLSQRQKKTQRILRDDGATYKPYSEQERTWQLDTIPLLLDSDTWGNIEAGLLQRAGLFNRLFKDIYGRQNLIRNGVIPPEAVFAHPGFLRPCHGIELPSEKSLILHGVDMIRTRDNSVCVIGDVAQSPGGAGYALENRIVMTRVFPSLFKNSQVRRLLMFFQTLRQTLNNLAPEGELANIVVLTQGSRSESYFEHAYLANYLGYSLVQGRDLIVRNGQVWTKSLSGLSRVDVILRRVDDYFCDPAELKSDSYLGVPGLLEVVRTGKVAIANPLGSGILESPVFLKYLSSISQSLLGEELMLPSAKTWWAYDAHDLEYILDNISQLIIKPVSKRYRQSSVLAGELSADALDQLRHDIQAQPLRYIAQQAIEPAYSPCLQEQAFVPRPTILRSFVVAGGDEYTAMPGGLTRVGKFQQDRLIADQWSALSKDTWVLANEPEQDHQYRVSKSEHMSMSEEQQNFPSRVVENMFWFGRYAVRAEYALRLLRTVFVQLNNTQHLSQESYRSILLAVTQVTETFPGFTEIDSAAFEDPETELLSLILDADRSGSVIASLNEMLNCAEEVKVLLSSDTQRVINDIRDNVRHLELSIRTDFASAPEEALDPLVTSLLALSGLIHESMIRGYGWHFTEIGRILERSYQTMSLIKTLLVPILHEQDEDSVLETVLLTLETLITYRRRYRARTDIINGLELTVLDKTNPRSLNYLLQELKHHVDQLPQRKHGSFLTREHRIMLELSNTVQLIQPEVLSHVNEGEERRESLNQVMEKSQSLLNELAIVLSDIYFDHTETHKDVIKASWEDEL